MSSQSSPCWIHIPDILTSWPWPRRCNPHYDICKAESSAWFESFGAFDKSDREAFNKCDFSLLASLTYPYLDKEGCRVGCDLMNLVFMIDEYTDKPAADVVRIQADIVMDALRNPHIPRPTDEWVAGGIARQHVEFWENAIRIITPTAQHRFIDTFQTYLDVVVEQVKDRTAHHVRTIESYFQVRRETIGVKSSFVQNQIYIDIPEHVMRHPVIDELTKLSIDMILIANDLLSYNREQARGDDAYNLITVVMHELNTDIQSAINWIVDRHERLVNQFSDEWHNIPTVTLGLPERARSDIQAYCQSLTDWIRGNDCWSFESERYFGKDGRQIQNTRRFRLLPRLHHITPVNRSV